MKRIKIKKTRLLKRNTSYEGISVEQMLRNLMKGEKVDTTGSDLNYTDKKDGVRPEFNIRTDRFEIAQESMETATKAYITTRDNLPKKEKREQEKSSDAEKIATGEPTNGTVESN